MANPIDKVIARKKLTDKVKKELKRRRRISRRTRGKKKTRKAKSKYKKRRVKKVTTTQTKQPPIKLTSAKGDKLEVNIVAKERRKKRKPKTYAEKRAEEIAKTGVADPSVLKQQQKIASDILGYTTHTKDPLTLRGKVGRYNVSGGVGGFGNVSGRYDTKREDQGIRVGLQSEASRKDAIAKRIEELDFIEFQAQKQARRKRQPNMGGRRNIGTQYPSDDDDDDDKPDRGGGISMVIKEKEETQRTPKPQPEPEPSSFDYGAEPSPRAHSRRSRLLRPATRDVGIDPTKSIAPIRRRTPAEEYFAGMPAPDTPLRFRPIHLPITDPVSGKTYEELPPQEEEPDIDEEIVELTGGQPLTPVNIGFQAIPEEKVRTPAEDYFSGSQLPLPPDTTTGFDPRATAFFTPTLTGSEILPPEEQPPTASRLDKPSARRAQRRGHDRPGSAQAPAELEISPETAFTKPKKPEPEPEAPPPPIQSVRRGRGRPAGSKNIPRPETPFVMEETGKAIDRASLKFEMLRIQRILKQRLGSWKAKEVDDVQSLQELNDAISSITGDAEITELIILYWQIRLQLGQLKQL